jgi:ketosteroid isomerase-like protein
MIITLMAVATLSLAQQGDTTLLRELVQIENEIARANRECDYKYFAYIEAEEFMFTDASGGVTNKQQDLATEKDCRKADYRSEIDEPRLLRYGDVAILNARSSVFLQNREGQAVVRRNRFTDVFVRRAGRWQLVVSGHSSRIPDQASR